MDTWPLVFALAFGAGLAMPIGAVIARLEHIQPRWLEAEFRHSVMAFGGGALLSAIALVLVPEGTRTLPLGAIILCFAGGGLAFMGLDVVLARKQTPAGQLTAMLADFVPEALALGAAFAYGGPTGPLLALLIGLQNLPEGFNAYREMAGAPSFRPARTIGVFTAMAFLGPVAALVGFFWLHTYAHAIAGIMLFAAGGILYLVFQDIAPQARLEHHWAPPLGAVAGFLLGVVGQMLVA